MTHGSRLTTHHSPGTLIICSDNARMVFRRQLLELLTVQPRTSSSLARALGVDRRQMDEDLRHMIRSARAAGHCVIVEPARCKSCGFAFDESKLTKPGKCPACRGTRVLEALIRVDRQEGS